MNKKPKRITGTVFSAEEITSILAGFSIRSISGVRNRAIVAMQFAGGLRISEALGLFKTDLDLENLLVKIRAGKGNRSRTVGILPSLIPYIETWITVRTGLGFNGRQPLFCTHTKGTVRNQSGTPISTAYFRGMLKRLEKKLGLEKRLHSHAFRHSHASLLAFQAVPLIEISSQLGHASIATTSAYMKKVAPADLASSLKKIDTKMLGINLPRIKI